MKVVVFLYASLYFVITLISGISQYTINFNTHKTLEHAYHRALRSSIEGDLLASGLIENLMQNEDIELYGGSATDVMQRR